MFETLPLALNFLIFAVLGFAIWQAGTRLSYFIDSIAEKTHIARGFAGLVFLATATEMPEVVTTFTASSSGNGALALNNMFGGMMMQLCVLAIADMFVRGAPLTSRPRSPATAVAALGILLSLSILLFFYLVGDVAVVAHVGLGSMIAAAVYLFFMFVLWRTEDSNMWSPVDLPEEETATGRENTYDAHPVRRLVFYSLLASVVILIAGALIVPLAEAIAAQTGLGTSFIGVSLLAMTTSLPELSTTIAAVRVRAYVMAISNVLGSNLIMTLLILPSDIAFTAGPILNTMGPVASFAMATVMLMTVVYTICLLTRPSGRFLGMGVASVILFVTYFAALAGLYALR